MYLHGVLLSVYYWLPLNAEQQKFIPGGHSYNNVVVISFVYVCMNNNKVVTYITRAILYV